MWIILTAQTKEKIYYSWIINSLFLDKRKECHRRTRVREDLLYIDHDIFNESKTRRKNLARAWIHNKRAYDIVPQSWILRCLKMYKISDQIVQFIEKAIKKPLMSGIDSRREIFVEVKIQIGIF